MHGIDADEPGPGAGLRRSPIDTGVGRVAVYSIRCRRYSALLRRLNVPDRELG